MFHAPERAPSRLRRSGIILWGFLGANAPKNPHICNASRRRRRAVQKVSSPQLSRGGKSAFDNYAHACAGCNGYKGDAIKGFDPVISQSAALYNPRVDNWEEHFEWNSSFSHILGLTSTGRATVAKLRLNRLGVVNLRKILTPLGKHPPIRS